MKKLIILFLFLFSLFLLFGCVETIDTVTNGLTSSDGDSSQDGSGFKNGSSQSGGGDDSGAPTVPDAKIDPTNPAYPQLMAYLEYIVDAEFAFDSQLIAGIGIADALDLNDTHPLRIKLEARMQKRIDEVVNSPKSTMKELIEVSQLAMALDLNSSGAMNELNAKVQARFDAARADPNSSIPDLIMAAQFVQQLKDPNGNTTEQIKPQIETILNQKFEQLDMCKQQLEEIADIAWKIGLESIQRKATLYITNAPSDCVGISFSQQVKDKWEGSNTTTAEIQGTFEELNAGGFVNTSFHMYYFKNAALAWTYTEPPHESGCSMISAEGSGNEILIPQQEGSIGVNVDEGKLSFNLTKVVKVDVTEEPIYSEECIDPDKPAPQAITYQRDQFIIVILDDDFAGSRVHLTGSATTEYKDGDNSTTSTTTYNIRLPDKYSGVTLD